MRTPPLTSSASSSSGFGLSSSPRSSSGPTTPTGKWRNHVQLLRHAFDSDDEDEEDFGLVKKQTRKPRDPLMPSRSSRCNALPVSASPSRFIVKGTVTPSRAAPLFAQFSKRRRSEDRGRQELDDWSEPDAEAIDESVRITPSPSVERKKQSILASPSSPSNLQGVRLRHPQSPRRGQGWPSHTIAPSSRAQQVPLMPISTPILQRPQLGSTNVASYMLAVRSNNAGHLHYATSIRGSAAFAGASRGVLSASRALGAGAQGALCNISQQRFFQSFQTTSTPGADLFTLPSKDAEQELDHPLSAEYSYSSRCLNVNRSQWLAVGSNEGRVFLLDTAPGAKERAIFDTPAWDAHDGTVFEVKWRFDDEQISTGGSDYRIRVWSTESGTEVASFTGHRGTPRSIAWDPNGGGHLLASGGRDGAIHIFDTRAGSSNGRSGSPVASVWGAHSKSTRQSRTRGRGKGGAHTKGVTSLTYVAGRGENMLCSAGCADGTLKMWDLRNLVDDVAEMDVMMDADTDVMEEKKVMCVGQNMVGRRQNKSSHGISSIVASSTKIFAASTDGCVYAVPASPWSEMSTKFVLGTGLEAVPLYDAAQRGNTLYARLALHDDERTLAVGCNSGTIAVWDTHVASLAAAEAAANGVGGADLLHGGQDAALLEMAKPAILQGGHRRNYEINGLSWAYDADGPTLASISDDFTVRTWHAQANRHIY